MDLKKAYIDLKKKFLEKEFSDMNEFQKSAIFKVEGQLTVFAGAGSGKTTVIINRIANMIDYGNTYEDINLPEGLSENIVKELEVGFKQNKKLSQFSDILNINKIDPQNILAITFTNKAAKELKSRIHAKLGGVRAQLVTASTFHSLCVKILRDHAEKIGYSCAFTIYDADDSHKLIKDCQKTLGIDEKAFPVKTTVFTISRAKDELLSSEVFKEKHQNDFRMSNASEVYSMYQARLKDAGAMDFDDLIFNTINLFEKYPEVLKFYKQIYKYIMVDEYQDTNYAQHMLIGKLVGKNGNICVVGDDDQSIYKFRGALVENILNFENQYKGATVVRLEENYRSTKNILTAANSVIENNCNRKGKTLWTKNSEGSKIKIHTSYNEHNEVDTIVYDIKQKIDSGSIYSDFAVLYRMSSQSNVIERVFLRNSIPYKIVGGMKFFERREIKDLISYLSVINNTSDEVRLKRIINQPKRSIGERTVSQINEIAIKENKPLFEVMKTAGKYEIIGRCVTKINEFVDTIELLIKSYETNKSIINIYNEILERIKYIDYLQQENDEAETRIANVKELASAIVRYEEENENPTLSGFLEEVSLAPEREDLEKDEKGEVTLMTVHASKGLEFKNVYLPGFEEGIFPGSQCAFKPEDLEEERRLAYVAITRAKEELFILHATSRMIFGSTSYNKPSRFLEEIPEEILTKIKSRGWGKPKGGEEKLASAYEIRVKSVVSARNFAQFPSVEGVKFEAVEVGYVPGEDVNHSIFGKGKIISVVPTESDSLLEIKFEKVGTKKLISRAVGLQKEIIQ